LKTKYEVIEEVTVESPAFTLAVANAGAADSVTSVSWRALRA